MELDKRTVTEKRRAANIAAAQHSTGPKSSQGKQRAAFNSFQHGAFASQDHILHAALARNGSDPSELEARRQELLDDWQPAGAQQKLLVDDLAWLYWLRDQSRAALLDGQARRLPRAQLERDQRRFQARHRAPTLNYRDFSPGGFAILPASEDKFTGMRELLDDLAHQAAEAGWTRKSPVHGDPLDNLDFLYGKLPATARGRRMLQLWDQCARDEAQANDPRVQQILTLIEEERAAVAEEEQLFRRQQELDIEQPNAPDGPGLHPLGETWRSQVLQLERVDRQINGKVRLLIRLQQHAVQMNRLEQKVNEKDNLDQPEGQETPDAAWEDASLGDNTEIDGTKPSDPLESTVEPIGAGSLDSPDSEEYPADSSSRAEEPRLADDSASWQLVSVPSDGAGEFGEGKNGHKGASM